MADFPAPSPLSRRTLLTGSLGAAAAGALTLPAAPSAAASPLVADRLTLPSGLQFGDPTDRSAVLWSRSSGPGRLIARLTAVDADGAPLRGKNAYSRTLRGGVARPETDFTARLSAENLPPTTRFAVTMQFEDEQGRLGEAGEGSFSTAAGGPGWHGKGRDVDLAGGQSFVWTGDTAGQGWGINEEIGGMFAYRTMHETAPDFFVHSGDTIYADGPLAETVEEPDGQIWRNLVTAEVSKVAETLEEYRGRHRYNLMDANIRAMYAEVPVIAQWDDHETTNNWWPGEVLDDERYTVRDVDTLAARGRRAWQEFQPLADPRAMGRGNGFEPARIHRKISRGPQLDLFSLDMRSFKSPNSTGTETEQTSILGEEQLQWLIREMTRSRATWKVVLNDLPLGVIVPDGDAQEAIANADDGAPLGRELEIARLLKALKDADVRNVVFLTADVHYCAAHHYSPERAAFTDFAPFWEFVAGPINAGSFGPNELDMTFGPEAVFHRAGRHANQSPRDGTSQYFGHVDLAADDTLTVSLRDGLGATVHSTTLRPE